MLVEKLIRKLKGDPNYTWKNSYTFRDLAPVMWDRGWQMVRGLRWKLSFKSSKGFVFIGSGVRIRCSHRITVGNNIIIDDHSVINALSTNGIVIGDNVSIGKGSTLVCTGVIAHQGVGISIGDGTGINAGAYLGGQGGISIGSNVIIGPGVKIFSENHIFSDGQINIKDQGVTRLGVSIGDNCWLGANVTVLDGVSIGEGCVIAAGSVVTKSLPAHIVAGGIPAKLIKSRVESKPSES